MASGTHITFEQLVKLPQVHAYLTAFRRASGLALQLLPANRPSAPAARNCNRAALEISAPSQTDRTSASAAIRLRVALVPLHVAGRHVADWCCGPVVCWSPFHSRSAPESRPRVGACLAAAAAARTASYWGLTPLSPGQFQTVEKLLKLFSQHIAQLLASESDRLWLASRCGEPGWITRARQFVQANLAEPLDSRRLAGVVHQDAACFARVFQEATGCSFPEYVLSQRIERAKVLLAERNLSIQAVARATGFRCRMEFVAAFRARVGMSPGQFQSAPSARAATAAESD